MTKWLTIALVICALEAPALAQNDPSVLGIQTRSKVQIGSQKPAVIVRPSVTVKRMSIRLTNQKTGRIINLKSGKIPRGKTKELTWKQAVGSVNWSADFKVTYGHGSSGAFTITFDASVFPKIASKISKKDVNLEERYLEVRLNQPAGKVDIQVTGDNGKVIHNGSKDFSEDEPGTPLRVDWEQPAGVAVLKIELRVYSQFGFWVGTEITPFEIEIPHEEVEFGFGKSNIAPEQAPKLDKTMTLLREKVQRYGGLVKLQLYVAGYTDTVGSKASNRELSEKRARSIAAYLRKKGLSIPVFYQGFGEDVLAVKTPDETKEARNRRAVYVLSSSAPAKQSGIPRNLWKRL